MMMSSASNSAASSVTVPPVTDAGTMTHAARGFVSLEAKSESDDAPVAPMSASSLIFGSLWSNTTHSWPSCMSRRTSPLPIRPSPIIPSCIPASSRRATRYRRAANRRRAGTRNSCPVCGPHRSAGAPYLGRLRADAGEEVVPRSEEGVGAVALQGRGQRVHVDPLPPDASQDLVGITAVGRKELADGAVGAEREQRLLRHRVDRERRRQRVDVVGVGQARVLRAGA